MRQVKVAPPLPLAGEWYTPEALGNREALPDDQVKVRLRSPTQGDRTGLALDVSTEALGRTARPSDVTRELLDRLVIEVAGYADANGKPIRNGRELFAGGEKEIVIEVAERCIASLGFHERDSPRSDAQHVSGSSGMPPSTGTAASAAPKAPMSDAAALMARAVSPSTTSPAAGTVSVGVPRRG